MRLTTSSSHPLGRAGRIFRSSPSLSGRLSGTRRPRLARCLHHVRSRHFAYHTLSRPYMPSPPFQYTRTSLNCCCLFLSSCQPRSKRPLDPDDCLVRLLPLGLTLLLHPLHPARIRLVLLSRQTHQPVLLLRTPSPVAPNSRVHRAARSRGARDPPVRRQGGKDVEGGACGLGCISQEDAQHHLRKTSDRRAAWGDGSSGGGRARGGTGEGRGRVRPLRAKLKVREVEGQ